MLRTYQKAPFPWFGGKSHAAPLVWSLLGDVDHYVEPFCGTMAVLLNRPDPCNRAYFSETVNDADGLLCNAWRAVQWHPDETARYASWPVCESDKHARQIALVKWREDRLGEKLAGSPEWCDPKMGGWWIWGVCCQIGAFAAGGPWTADESGRIVKIDRQKDKATTDIRRDLPHVSNNGQGVNSAQMREIGVIRNLPHVSDDGRGVNSARMREIGVIRNRPHVSHNGQGVNAPQMREIGVLSDDPQNEFHPMTMPELTRWFQWLSARLRHVRILNGDWARCVTSGVLKTMPVRMGGGKAGVFLDPPYADTAGRNQSLYALEDLQVAHTVREWCLRNGNDPDYRIVLAGYEGEHGTSLTDAGWSEHEWFKDGFLRGGMAQIGADRKHQQHRERLWSSPHCLQMTVKSVPQTAMDWDEE